MSEPTDKSNQSDSTRVSATPIVPIPFVIGPADAPPVSSASPPSSVPARMGEFEILGKLGEGAFGQVFLARQVSLGREVALKVTHDGEGGSDLLSGFASLVPETGGRNEEQ